MILLVNLDRSKLTPSQDLEHSTGTQRAGSLPERAAVVNGPIAETCESREKSLVGIHQRVHHQSCQIILILEDSIFCCVISSPQLYL